MKALNNLGPPYFFNGIQTEFNIAVGDKIDYNFPSIIDPDDDKILMDVELGESIMFTNFEDKRLFI